ncbi:MAG TPA: CRISPR-associated protein Cas4 [Clostridiaceae bacterium]|nr:CRISPR-associated protein Cas4 [Clostridiaceae bacterium]
MTLYKEDDYLQLSGIQHFAFCKRQWALAYIELQWADNLRTVEGELLHKHAHDGYFSEKRGELIISRGMPIHSSTLGVSGQCDVVEFRRDDKGVPLFGREGLYTVTPVEYKKGKPKKDDIDILQLTAQAMCLEEMLCCNIEYGYIYYGETKHRTIVQFSDELREKVRRLFNEMHQMFERKYTPKVKRTKSCNACSLKDICLPALNKTMSVEDYVSQHVNEDEV